MNENEIRELEQRVAAIAVDDAASFLAWLPLAARLAAWRRPASLAGWPALARRLRLDLDRLLADLARRGLRELRRARGRAQVEALILAQDLSFLLEFEGDLLPAGAKAALGVLVEEAEEILLDDEAADLLATAGFVAPRGRGLDATRSPRRRGEAVLLAALALPFELTEASWIRRTPRRRAAAVRFEPRSSRSRRRRRSRDPEPGFAVRMSEKDNGRIEIRIEFAADLDGPGRHRELLRDHSGDKAALMDWTAEILEAPILGSPQAAAGRSDDRQRRRPDDRFDRRIIDAIRLGRLPAVPDDTNGGKWRIETGFLPAARRRDLLDQELAILVRPGLRILIR